MRLARRALGTVYTPHALVEQVLDGVPAPPEHATVLDLACGDGAFLLAAAARWPTVRLLGVDIDGEALRRAGARLGGRATLLQGDGLELTLPKVSLVVGNPPWGAGKALRRRRGEESASRFVARALEQLEESGRLCLLLPLAWVEIEAHRAAREQLVAVAEVERLERLGHVFPGVNAPAALVQARKNSVAGAERDARRHFSDDLEIPARRIEAQMVERGERLGERARFVLGIITGCNRELLGSEGEPILRGRDITSYAVHEPKTHLRAPLDRLQQVAPIELYRRPKLVYRFIASHPVAAVDRKGLLTLNSANAIVAADPELDLDFLGAVLNSSPARFVHQARVRLPRILRSHLESVLLPRADRSEIIAVAERARALSASPSDLEIAEIDERIMDLYGFSEEDRRTMRRKWPSS